MCRMLRGSVHCFCGLFCLQKCILGIWFLYFYIQLSTDAVKFAIEFLIFYVLSTQAHNGVVSVDVR
jgi:hypothetical protein